MIIIKSQKTVRIKINVLICLRFQHFHFYFYKLKVCQILQYLIKDFTKMHNAIKNLIVSLQGC